MNELAGAEILRAHHGSIAHEQRRAIEDLKAGRIRGILATSSLELAVPRNPLDVLAQQVVAICATEPQAVGDLERDGHTLCAAPGTPTRSATTPRRLSSTSARGVSPTLMARCSRGRRVP